MRWIASITAFALATLPLAADAKPVVDQSAYKALTVDAFSSFYPLRSPAGGWVDSEGRRDALTGAVALGQMLAAFRRASRASEPDPLRDGELRIPEHGNHLPDVLDEARFELEWLASLQFSEGKFAGLLRDGEDGEPSLTATLGFAAVASAASRYYARFDRAFIDAMRAAAMTAYAAARAHSELVDGDVSGALYWAGAELFVSTGDEGYFNDLKASPFWAAKMFDNPPRRDNLAAFGRLLLATEPRRLSGPDSTAIRQSVVDGADALLSRADESSPYARVQGAIVLAYAFDISGHTKYRDAVISAATSVLGGDQATLHLPLAADSGAPELAWNAALGQLASWLYDQ